MRKETYLNKYYSIMEKYFFEQRPKEVEFVRFIGKRGVSFHFDIEETEGGFLSDDVFVETTAGTTYDTLVAAVVRSRYSADDVEAILNNYLLDAETGRKEFDELQAWRTKAKQAAHEALALLAEEGTL